MKYSSLPLLALLSLSLTACSPDGVGDLAAGTNDSSGGLAADFQADLVHVIEGLEVHFADHSTGTVLSWSWDLDGDSIEDSTQQNPSFIYQDGGLYTVSLAVNGGASSETKAGYIQVEHLPEAGFETKDLAGPLDHEVEFTNLSNHADAFAWEFPGGNPSASTEEDPPPVTYDTIGFKTVRITVTGVGGFDDSFEEIDYIVVSPLASFTAEDFFAGDGAGEGAVKGAAGPGKPLVVRFQNISNQNGENDDVDYFWDFGEGDAEVFTDNLLDLTNEYENPGEYTVLLRAESRYGDNTLMIDQYVAVVPTVLDPSFELQTAAVPPQAPWTMFFGSQGQMGHLIRSTDEGDTEELMPFPPDPGDGSSVQWVEVDTTSTNGAQPPLNAGQDPPVETDDPAGRGSAGVRQQIAFALDAEGIPCSILQFEAAFITSEFPEEDRFNDYMSVDLSFEGAHYNLYYRDTFSDFTEDLSGVHGEPITPVETVSVDLLNLFDFPPRISGEQFTLWVSVGNVGDGAMSSWGYVDNLRLLAIGGEVVVEFDSNGDTNDESGDCPVEVTFLDTTPDVTTIQRKWQFGDGAVDLGNDPNPTHIYESPDTYDVRLTIVAQEGTGSLMKPNHVDVQQAVAFHANSVVTPFILDGTQVTFINDSSGARSYRWTITEPGGQTEIVKSDEDSVTYTFHFPSFLPGDPDGNPDTWEVLLEAYCDNDTASGTPDGSFSMFIQVRQGFGDLYTITQASCAVTFCHVNTHPCIDMNTSKATLYDRFIDGFASNASGCSCSGETHKQYVDESQIGDTALARSLLWRKLRPPGGNDPEEGGQCGGRMPAGGSLSNVQLVLFEAWFRGGAKE